MLSLKLHTNILLCLESIFYQIIEQLYKKKCKTLTVLKKRYRI